MPARIPPLLHPVFAMMLAIAGCSAPEPPFAQLSGVILDTRLAELSGLAASRAHAGVLWALGDGSASPRLFALGTRGGVKATFRVAGVANTDWEDLAAFTLDGRNYLLIADTGDNGGLRRTLQLHIVEEPRVLADGVLTPAWSIAFRWPDGPRDCEAVAVDAARGQVLLISKRRRPPELFALPLRPVAAGVQVARRLGTLAGVPTPNATALRQNARLARIRSQVTAADISPDGGTMAVLTYQNALLYPRAPADSWQQALAGQPRVYPLAWLLQAEGLAWAIDGQGLYVSGETAPAPLLYLSPLRARMDSAVVGLAL